MKVHEPVSDELWDAIAPLLPPDLPRPKGGRPPLPHRPALCGLIDVLKTGIQWQMLPAELGCGSGSSCWRRLHQALLDRLGDAGRIDWSRERGQRQHSG